MTQLSQEARRSRQQQDDFRAFLRQENLRQENLTRRLIAEINSMGDRAERSDHEYFARLAREREEDRVERQALLRAIERMARLDPGSSAG